MWKRSKISKSLTSSKFILIKKVITRLKIYFKEIKKGNTFFKYKRK